MTYQTLDLKELNLNFNNMAIDFYELGKRGYKTPKTKQSGLQSLVGSIDKTVGGMLKASQEKTAELTASMTAGVPIDKVPEELRGQVTDFLTGNKKAYTEATKVIASGVNPQSEQYKNAVETINSVNTKFENLSGNLENIALERQKYLDDPSYSPNTSRSDATTMSDLANGSLYNRMSLNEDGSWNYTDTKGESKAFKDFKVNKQGYLGQQGFIAMTEHLDKNALDINGNVKKWEGGLENYYSLQLDQLFNKLGPKGSQDYVMADDEFLQARYDDKKLDGTKGSFEDYKDALTQGSKEEIVKEYKQYNLDNLKTQHEGAVAKAKPGSGSGTDTGGEWTYSSGKYLPVLGGNRSMPPDFANAMKISLQEAADGKETSFDFFDTKLNYDPKANNGEGDWSFNNGDEKVSYGDTKNLINNWLKIKDPGFVNIAAGASSGAPVELKTPTIKNTPFLPDGKVYKGGATSKDLIATTGDDGDQVVRNLNERIINPPDKEYRFVVAKPTDFIKTDQKGVPEFQKGLAKWAVNKWKSVYRFRIFDGNNKPVGTYSFKINDNIPNSENPINTVNDSKESAKEFNRVMKELGIKLQDGAGLD